MMNEESSSTTVSPPSREPLDASRWEKLQTLQQATGRDFLGEVIDLFLNDTPARLDELRDAVTRRQAHPAERLAHSIKGSCSNIGAPLMESAAAELEQQLAQGSFDGTDEMLARLIAESDRVCEALEALRHS